MNGCALISRPAGVMLLTRRQPITHLPPMINFTLFAPLLAVTQNLGLPPVEHGRPELSALIFAYPHARYILPTIQIEAYGNIHRLLYNLPLAADMVVDGNQKYHRIDGLQRPLRHSLAIGRILSVIRLTVLSETEIP